MVVFIFIVRKINWPLPLARGCSVHTTVTFNEMDNGGNPGVAGKTGFPNPKKGHIIYKTGRSASAFTLMLEDCSF